MQQAVRIRGKSRDNLVQNNLMGGPPPGCSTSPGAPQPCRETPCCDTPQRRTQTRYPDLQAGHEPHGESVPSTPIPSNRWTPTSTPPTGG
ncbi:MAG: hypothetical protein Ct9H300mP1_07710 [Planctomycetaceae bacterium]|nr:MAG: hypothetical protein Ct9H300mP1_07710 [Planctomycetaceae bacterium]